MKSAIQEGSEEKARETYLASLEIIRIFYALNYLLFQYSTEDPHLNELIQSISSVSDFDPE